MKSLQGLVIIGNGGMARSLRDLIGFCDPDKVKGFFWSEGTELDGLPVFNSMRDIPNVWGCVLGMLDPVHRREHVSHFGRQRFATVTDGRISSAAIVMDGGTVVHGAYVMSGAIIQPFAHVHTSSIVGHDCNVGPYCFLGPGTILGGRSSLKEQCRIGMGTNILPDVNLGACVTVAAGSVVTKSFGSGVIIAGNPARVVGKTVQSSF